MYKVGARHFEQCRQVYDCCRCSAQEVPNLRYSIQTKQDPQGSRTMTDEGQAPSLTGFGSCGCCKMQCWKTPISSFQNLVVELIPNEWSNLRLTSLQSGNY